MPGAVLAPFLAAARPLVVAQLGQSLDGRIATVSGESRYINGGAALDHLHALRAHVDAVVVGIGTVVADDPLLTVRRVPGRNPARVIIDPNGRLPEGARCIADDGADRLVIRTAPAAVPRGVEELVIPAHGPWINPATIIAALQRRGYHRVLIEGGARTISLFLDSGRVDRLHVLVAPMIIGSGKPGLELAPIVELGRALRPATTVAVLADGNVLFACDLRQSQDAAVNGNGHAVHP
ncbi:MAG: RibD family protein [Alphaproteobacteria bacterium]|nr:RibD family protein [Alphaproteobacteria bacterium]